MRTAGIITEYNPLHGGHVRLLREVRNLLGEDTAVVCCMSGDFVQRGEAAVVRRQARARAAVLSGADLVLELPLPWAVSSAEGFAQGAVFLLDATGVVDYLVFGSESGSTDAILRTADLLLDPAFSPLLRAELVCGDSFPAARQRAAVRLARMRSAVSPYDVAAALSRPNDALAVEYCKALLRFGSPMRPLAVLRTGSAHDSADLRPGAYPSATAVRDLLRRGETDAALSWMAPAMADAFREELSAGRAPVFLETAERAVLALLRSLSREDFAALDSGHEGVGYRLYRAVREASSVREILETAKTRRYPLARLRRMVLWACLGLSPPHSDAPDRIPCQHDASAPDNPSLRPDASAPENLPIYPDAFPPGKLSLWAGTPPYLRPLAASAAGQRLLARMRSTAALPILVRPKDVKKLGPAACSLFSLEARAADLYALCYPDLAAAHGGSLWREGLPPPLSRA